MLPLLTYPLALLAAAALPTLAAIYILRNKFRRRQVSSLLLWQFQIQSREGGAKVQRLQLPLVFFLELLALALLVCAATGPRWQLPQTTRPLVVVLDDSLSMLAGRGNDTARARAVAALDSLLKSRKFLSIRLVLAGPKPRVLGSPLANARDLPPLLAQWHCLAPTASLDAAISLASDLGGPQADLLVLTDHVPPNTGFSGGRLQWWGLGAPEPNLAFINAARTVHGDADRCLLEVANFSKTASAADVRVVSGSNLLHRSVLNLDAGARQRVILQLPAAIGPVEAVLPADSLTADNRVVLLPPPRRRVRVQVSVEDESLRQLMQRTLDATGLRSTVTAQPEITIHTTRAAPAGTNTWGLRLVAGTNVTAFTGPFVLEGGHPLARGLELEGVLWAADTSGSNSPVAMPVISAGNTPLLLAQGDALGRQQVTLLHSPAQSTLVNTPNWPVLFHNLLTWRARETPGLQEHNFRLGSDVPFRPPGGPVRMQRADGSAKDVAQPGANLLLEPEVTGLHAVIAGGVTNAFAVNFLSPEESDLSRATSQRLGQWERPGDMRLEYTTVVWLFLLGTLVVMVAHLFLVTAAKGRV
jgi:hypothetical protein